jgi:hypothetical protein
MRGVISMMVGRSAASAAAIAGRISASFCGLA